MKNYEAVTTNNEQLKNHNAYLSCQLDDVMKHKRKALVGSSSSPGSAKNKKERHSRPLVSSSEEEP